MVRVSVEAFTNKHPLGFSRNFALEKLCRVFFLLLLGVNVLLFLLFLLVKILASPRDVRLNHSPNSTHLSTVERGSQRVGPAALKGRFKVRPGQSSEIPRDTARVRSNAFQSSTESISTHFLQNPKGTCATEFFERMKLHAQSRTAFGRKLWEYLFVPYRFLRTIGACNSYFHPVICLFLEPSGFF